MKLIVIAFEVFNLVCDDTESETGKTTGAELHPDKSMEASALSEGTVLEIKETSESRAEQLAC